MDLSKALPTPSYSSLGALVILGTEEEEQGLLSSPFVPRAAEVRSWRGKAARMEQGRDCGEESAGEEALPCHGESQGHAGHGFWGLSPPQDRRITARFCHPPSPPCAAMPPAGRARRPPVGMLGGHGAGRAAEP